MVVILVPYHDDVAEIKKKDVTILNRWLIVEYMCTQISLAMRWHTPGRGSPPIWRLDPGGILDIAAALEGSVYVLAYDTMFI